MDIIDQEMGEPCNNGGDPDISENIVEDMLDDDEKNMDVSLEEELDDAYAHEYFHRFEPNPKYDKNALMPADDGSSKSSNTLRQYCKERGLSYIRRNGIEQPARQIQETCTCRRLCYLKFTDDVRRKLLSNLLELSAIGQILFLSGHITPVTAQRPTHFYQRKSVHVYHLPANSGRVKVCMRMFANTFDITDKKLRTLHDKIHCGASDALKKTIKYESNVDIMPLQDASSCEVEEMAPEKGNGQNDGDSHSSIIFIESLQMRDLGDMEEYFLRYETDIDYESRVEMSTLRSKLGKPTTKKILDERRYRKAKGYSYQRTDGTEVPARKLKPPCSCRLMCYEDISIDARQVLLNNLLNLSFKGQENFICSHIYLRSTTKPKNWIDHFLPTTSGLIKVCKVMFLNTYDLSEKKLRVLVTKKIRDSQEVLGGENDYTEQKATDSEPLLKRKKVAARKEDSAMDSVKSALSSLFCKELPLEALKNLNYHEETDAEEIEADDETEIKFSYQLSNTNSEDECNKKNNSLAVDVELNIPVLNKEMESTEQGIVESMIRPVPKIDDAFLDQYFYRYENNFGLEETTNNKVKSWRKSWINTEADPSPFQPCSCVMYKCSSWLTDDLRHKIFTRYVRLSPLNKKRFLNRLISKEHKKRNYKYQSRRQFSMFYFIPTNGGPVKVCKIMFMNTFKVTDRKLRSLVGMEKFAEPPEETTNEDNSITLEPDFVVDVDDSFIGQITIDDSCNDADGRDNDDAEVNEADDEMEIKFSYELFNANSEDENKKKNSMAAVDVESNEATESTEQGNCIVEPMIAEIDDAFLDHYFYRYENNFGMEEPANNNKSMSKCWIHTEADETPFQPCSCVKHKCFSWFTDDLRHKMFNRYARLTPLNKKRFLYRHIRRDHKKRSFKYQSRRHFSMFYFVPTKRGHVKVCKVMFMNTFKVTDKKLRGIVGREKFAEPPEEPTNEDNTCITLEPDFVVDVDDSFLEQITSDMSCIDANAIGSCMDSVKNSLNSLARKELPLASLTNQDFHEDSDVAEEIEADDETEMKFSYELFNSKSEDESNKNNSMTVDVESSISAFNEASEQNNCIVESMIAEIDDAFLDQYFYRYENNFGMEEPTYNKDKSMRKSWIYTEADETPFQSCSCVIYRCFSWFTDDLRHKMFNRYARLSPLNKKRFLNRHIRREHKKRNDKYQSRRHFSMFYFVPTKRGHVRICKVMFMNTFKVTDKKLRHIVGREKFVEPPEETIDEENNCIKLDPDDFVVDFGQVSCDISNNDINETDLLNSMLKVEPESSSSNQHSNIFGIDTESNSRNDTINQTVAHEDPTSYCSDETTDSCKEDEKLPSNDNDNEVGPVKGFKLRPVVEFDDSFLDEYFIRYETNFGQPEPASGRPRKMWIKGESTDTVLLPCSCTRKCSVLYPDDLRHKVFTRFTKLSTLNQKRFLYRHIKLDHPQRRRGNQHSRRQNSWFYFLPAKSGRVKVCKGLFMNTFNVTEKKLRLLVQRKQFAEHDSDEDSQSVQHDPTNILMKSHGSSLTHPCDDLLSVDYDSERRDIETPNQISDDSTGEYLENETNIPEVAESAVEPLFTTLGCSLEDRVLDNTSTIVELDETFLDEYFHRFTSNVMREKLENQSGDHTKTLDAPKILLPACSCPRKCHAKFPDKIRQMILDRYAKLSVSNRMRFLVSHVKRKTPSTKMDEQLKNKLTCFYYLPTKFGHVGICNIMFLNTFNINEKKLHRLITQTDRFPEVAGQEDRTVNIETKSEHDFPMDIKIELDSDQSNEMIVGDYDYGQRGDDANYPPEKLLTDDNTCDKTTGKEGNAQMLTSGNCRRNETNHLEKTINATIVRFAKEHICSFPRITSHFCQAVNKTKYLSCFLDVTSMYIAYLNACKESSKEPVPSKIYNAILQNERAKDPALPSACDECEHVENIDLGDDNFNLLNEYIGA